MDTFNDAALTPEQIKMLTLQFMGQHLTGDLKELDKNLISKTTTLKGMELNPEAVLRSIPVSQAHHQSILEPTHQSTPALSQNHTLQPPVEVPSLSQVTSIPTPNQQLSPDKDQLEFSFDTSPLSERIFDALERIEKRLCRIEESMSDIDVFKKKE